MVEIYSDEPGHRDDAIAACRAALRIVPDDAATHLHLANLLAPLPEHRAEADAEYRAALALAPKNMEIQQCYARFEAAGK
jgi:Tfp pilus assembly protein PilF